MGKILISACLLGQPVRYDGGHKRMADHLLAQIPQDQFVTICPEMAGGLPTPRKPAEIQGGDGHDVLAGRARVITNDGDDVTDQFIAGAQATLAFAKANNVTKAILMKRSPSCGSRQTYDGSFSGVLIPGMGVTAALLSQNGIEVVTPMCQYD